MKYLQFLIILLLFTKCNSVSNKNSTESLEDKADRASNTGDYKNSIYYYNQLIKMDSSNGKYYFGRADSYWMLIKRKEAESDYLKSIQLNYREGSCYYNLGLLNTFLKDSMALIYFKKALETYPNRSDIQKEYNECIERLKTNPSSQ